MWSSCRALWSRLELCWLSRSMPQLKRKSRIIKSLTCQASSTRDINISAECCITSPFPKKEPLKGTGAAGITITEPWLHLLRPCTLTKMESKSRSSQMTEDFSPRTDSHKWPESQSQPTCLPSSWVRWHKSSVVGTWRQLRTAWLETARLQERKSPETHLRCLWNPMVCMNWVCQKESAKARSRWRQLIRFQSWRKDGRMVCCSRTSITQRLSTIHDFDVIIFYWALIFVDFSDEISIQWYFLF